MVQVFVGSCCEIWSPYPKGGLFFYYEKINFILASIPLFYLLSKEKLCKLLKP